jgi:NAD(P)-dependent dehydrogenase (short-subunit alcohol dehydrogenase family)
MDETRRRWGLPFHLVNNAGTVGQAPLVEIDATAWDRVFAVNVRGPFLLTRAFLRDRPPGLGGSIVNVTSISGVPGPAKLPGFSAYAASKAALALLTEVAAAEARPLGVRVNAVAPGSTDTAMFRAAAPGVEPDLQPEDVARVILFASSDDARGMNGQTLNVWG